MSHIALTPDIVRFLRSTHSLHHMSTRCFVRHFAKLFEVSPNTIYDVIRYRTWKNVAFPITDEEAGLAESVAELKTLDPFGVWLDCDYI